MSGMIVYKNWVIVIGGCGNTKGPFLPGSKWIQCDDGSGESLTMKCASLT